MSINTSDSHKSDETWRLVPSDTDLVSDAWGIAPSSPGFGRCPLPAVLTGLKKPVLGAWLY